MTEENRELNWGNDWRNLFIANSIIFHIIRFLFHGSFISLSKIGEN